MNKQSWGIGWYGGAAAAVIAFVLSACGEDFTEGSCKSNRTCTPTDGGGGGAQGSEDGGVGAVSTMPKAGSAAGGSEVGSGGQIGEPPGTVGNPCVKAEDCDDGDSCTGVESCVDGLCAAGAAVECPSGLVCSAAKNDACVFPSEAPWIVYTADAEKKDVFEAYGVKVDLLGTMTPVKLSPALEAGWSLYGRASRWSPNGSAAILTTADEGALHAESYVVRFGDTLPEAPVHLTKGMSPSKRSSVEWSPSGNSVAISRDDGLHVVDIAADGKLTASKATPDGYDQIMGWIKNDNEIVYVARNVISTKVSAALAVRNGGAWTRKPLVADMGTLYIVVPTGDRSLLGYFNIDAQVLRTVWTIETVEGSKPTKIVGPVHEVAMYPSPDVSHFVLATTDKATYKTTVFGGAAASLLAPPILKQGVTIGSNGALGITVEGPWAPDSSRAALFQNGTFGKQLVMYEPGAAEEWHALPVTQALQGDRAPLWSVDSKTLALPTRVSAESKVMLSLITSPGYQQRDIDNVPTGGGYYTGPFSTGGEFFVYAKAQDMGGATDGYYIDLRQGLAAAPNPVEIPGALGDREFASHGTDFIYIRDSEDCYYLDLSGAAAAEPVLVNAAGNVASCTFQKLP